MSEYSELNQLFYNKYQTKPHFHVKVPGRVNLIGEHIDYCGYAVLPMAIEQCITAAVSIIPEPVIHLTNKDPLYEDQCIDLKNFECNKQKKPMWYEYPACGAIGAYRKAIELGIENPIGLKMAINGTIPPAAGLSSSSALVCAAALAFVEANKIKLSKSEMATLCAESERLIGTQGGGMDQAIAFLAQPGYAQYITFNPVTATPVKLPNDVVFVVAHSLVQANKAATDDFNDRVAQCREAAKSLLSDCDLQVDKQLSLSEVQLMLKADLDSMVEKSSKLSSPYKQRAIHVYSEAARVEQFKELCKSTVEGAIEHLGQLMRESHESLQKNYECSHNELDKIVKLSDKFGVRARLTGAGWGGCIVAICPVDRAESYVEMLLEEFYKDHPSLNNCNEKKTPPIFITKPSEGAKVILGNHINGNSNGTNGIPK